MRVLPFDVTLSKCPRVGSKAVLTASRRSKIKCVHDGSPPCRNCVKSRRIEPNECILSGPFDSRDAAVRIGCSPIRLTPSTVRTFSSQHAPRFASRVTPQCSTRSSPTTILEAGSPIERQQNLNSQQDIISSLPTSTIIQSVSIFARKFPELAFIHLSSFSGIAGSFEHVQRRNHIAAILSLCADLLPSTTPNLQSPETYAKYTREGLSRLVINPPSITVVQTLLTIAMYDWGNGNGYGAWMYGGKWTRLQRSYIALTIYRYSHTNDAINPGTQAGS